MIVRAERMASQKTGRTGLADYLFFAHPRSLGMSWTAHGLGALGIGVRLLGAGLACLVHALVPGFFTETTGKAITSIYEHAVGRRTGTADPENWPDYEI